MKRPTKNIPMLIPGDSEATLPPMTADDFITMMADHYGVVHVRRLHDGTGAVIATPASEDRCDKAVYVPAEGDILSGSRAATPSEWFAATASSAMGTVTS